MGAKHQLTRGHSDPRMGEGGAAVSKSRPCGGLRVAWI